MQFDKTIDSSNNNNNEEEQQHYTIHFTQQQQQQKEQDDNNNMIKLTNNNNENTIIIKEQKCCICGISHPLSFFKNNYQILNIPNITQIIPNINILIHLYQTTTICDQLFIILNNLNNTLQPFLSSQVEEDELENELENDDNLEEDELDKELEEEEELEDELNDELEENELGDHDEENVVEDFNNFVELNELNNNNTVSSLNVTGNAIALNINNNHGDCNNNDYNNYNSDNKNDQNILQQKTKQMKQKLQNLKNLSPNLQKKLQKNLQKNLNLNQLNQFVNTNVVDKTKMINMFKKFSDKMIGDISKETIHIPKMKTFVIDFLKILIAFSLILILILLGALPTMFIEGNYEMEINNSTSVEKWTYLNSVYFTVVTLTTIGYGDFTPSTLGGRLYIVFFGFIGLSIVSLWISFIGGAVMNSFGTGLFTIFLYLKRCCQIRRRDISKDLLIKKIKNTELSNLEKKLFRFFNRGITQIINLILILGIYCLVGGAIMGNFEGWQYYDSFYYSFVSLTSIGYGDLFPKSQSGKIFFCFFSVGGLGLLAILLGFVGKAIQESVIENLQKAQKKALKEMKLKQVTQTMKQFKNIVKKQSFVKNKVNFLKNGIGDQFDKVGQLHVNLKKNTRGVMNWVGNNNVVNWVTNNKNNNSSNNNQNNNLNNNLNNMNSNDKNSQNYNSMESNNNGNGNNGNEI